MNNKKVWFVTGASKGIGLALVKQLLKEGYDVSASTRNVKELINQVGEYSNFLPLKMDLTDRKSVEDAVNKAVKKFGRLDALVNNAGFGMLGAFEELSMDEIRNEFEVNLFGAMNVIQAALPQLRNQRSGHIFNVTSIAGWKGDAGASVYNSSKYALEGLSDALSRELQPLGIKVTAIAPGPFRTNFLGEGSAYFAQPAIEDYSYIHQHKDWLEKNQHWKQLGNPEKAPDVFIRVFNEENPPAHVLMGSDAVRIVSDHLLDLQASINDWKEISNSTDIID